MLRGYRGIFIAVVGLVLSGQHPNAVAQPKQDSASERSTRALENISSRYDEQAKRAEGSRETDPCEQGDDKRYSDLCAQWKAADAAADSAWWAAVSGYATAISTILVLIALYFAFRSNWIARDTAKRQLRAYISVEPQGVYERDDNGFVTVPILFKNAGQTPAYHVTIQSWFQLCDDPLSFDPYEATKEVGAFDPTEITVAPGDEQCLFARLPFSPTKPNMLAISEKRCAIIHYGMVLYQDAFEAWRTTEFAHYHWGEELSHAEAKRCRLGNHAE